MKRLATALLGGYLTALCLSAGAQGSLVRGGDFEMAGSGGVPAGWYRYGEAGSMHQAAVVEGGRSGNCVRVEGQGSYAGVASVKIPLDQSGLYAARAWSRPAQGAAGAAYLKVDYFDAAGKYLGESRVKPSVRPAGEAWQYLSLVTPGNLYPDATQIAVAVGVNRNTPACFDDVELLRREPEPNLLPDGGFEVVAGDTPSSWGLSQAQGGTVRRVRRSVPVKEGWSCLQLIGRSPWVSSDSGGSVPLDRNAKYTLTGWARARTGKARIKINYLKDGMWLGHITSPDAAGNQWEKLTVVGDAARYPEATRISAGANCSGPEVDAMFDHLVLTVE